MKLIQNIRKQTPGILSFNYDNNEHTGAICLCNE